jgi:hypothetical protein
MNFFLGTHKPGWLGRVDVPLFVSHRTLRDRVQLPRATGPWALDSGGFTELSMFGRWETSPAEYAGAAVRYRAGVGQLEWAAIQDWMCEPFMLEKTGKSVAEHQALSIASYLDLAALAPEVPWAPVLQGWAIDDYLGHVEQYRAAGVDLDAAPVVGVGSVCRRQATDEAAQLFAELASLGLRLHGFGLKIEGLRRASARLASSDSMAWSLYARRSPPLPGCLHKSCANCVKYALKWRRKVLKAIERPCQGRIAWGVS